jgi:hypothetical protein
MNNKNMNKKQMNGNVATLTTKSNNKQKSNAKNKDWMRNKRQLKNPKIYNLMAVRSPDGSFHLLGGCQKVLIRKNQYSEDWVNVDTRDIACELRNSPIKTK